MSTPDYLSPELPFAQRAADLVSRMSLEEKVSQMVHDAPAIPRLGIPAYNWWNECLHGVGRAGIATVFPQAIGLAAMFDAPFLQRIATAISDEARAKHHDQVRASGGSSAWYYGLTFWSPNINLFRDPRWGRGQETYGEDPYLSGRLGVAFVRGLQGDDPTYLKVVATPKHFAVHSGPEAERHGFNAVVSQRDLHESYLPHFRACIQEGKAASIMPAYNRTNGEACAASPTLLGKILRQEWGFQGYVVSDCGAIDDIYRHHGLASTPAEAAALAVKAGCDLNCGCTFQALVVAVNQGLIDEAQIDRSVQRLFEYRMRLGMFDPPERVPYTRIGIEVNDCPAHRELAREAARRSLVLLKNDGILPLDHPIRRVAVIGPNADDASVLLGNYNGTPSESVTPFEGIRTRAMAAGMEMLYARGCDLTSPSREGFDDAVEIATQSDVVIAVVGLSPRLEGEEGEEHLIDKSGDRKDLTLPPVQEELLRAVAATDTPMIVVLLSGSAVAIPWAAEHAAAILAAWYGGEEAGTAIAEALWGDFSPAGRLPVTFYRSLDQLPPFADYAMRGRTYRFFEGEPLYRFGFGLSYTSFQYSDLQIGPASVPAGSEVAISATVTNTGLVESDEVAQLYVTDVQASVPVPIRQLQGFTRLRIPPGESRRVTFGLRPEQMACYLDDGTPIIEPGVFRVSVGGGQPVAGQGIHWVEGQFEITAAR